MEGGRWPESSLLAELPENSRTILLRLGVPVEFPTGKALLREGEASRHLVLLTHGITKVTAGGEDGKVALLAVRVAGDLVGEMASLDGEPRSATVTAAGRVVGRVITHADFNAYLRSHPAAGIAVSRAVVGKLRWANRRRVDFTGCEVHVRLARVLNELARSYGKDTAGGIVVGVALTQPELAGLVGAGEITVHRALADLRRRQILTTGYRQIVITDPDQLEAAAEPAA